MLMSVVILLCFHRDEHNDILAVADWGQKLSFYQLSGKQVNVTAYHKLSYCMALYLICI